MAEGSDDIEIRQTLTEVLTGLREDMVEGFRELRGLIGEKASRRDLDALSTKVEAVTKSHDQRITRLEEHAQERKAARRSWTLAGKIFGASLAGLAAVAGVVYTIAYIAHPH